MAEDKDWFTRQASRTAEDIKQLPEWLRTQRDETPNASQSGSAVQEPNKNQRKVSA